MINVEKIDILHQLAMAIILSVCSQSFVASLLDIFSGLNLEEAMIFSYSTSYAMRDWKTLD